MENILFKLQQIKKTYGKEFTLSVGDFNFHRGDVYALVGPNGAGKTTLIKLLAALILPDSGNLYLDNIQINKHADYNQLFSVRRRMTFVSQKPLLFDKSVFANVMYGLKVRKTPFKTASLRVEETLKLLDILHLAGRNGKTLSAGEAQKAALARALVLQTEALLLDEPFANISPHDIPAIEKIILERARGGCCVIIATHLLSGAGRLTDKIIHLRNGIISEASVENILKGEVVAKDNEKYLKTGDAPLINIITEKSGNVVASINPHDILISLSPISSSARNCLKCIINRVSSNGETVKLEVDVGTKLTVLVTKLSYDELKLNIGKEVFLTFKATAVEIF
ncbi:MAG: ATP-binding cassette domain-containing protein [Planctomycetota bacterium]